jgi:hypothetical protein
MCGPGPGELSSAAMQDQNIQSLELIIIYGGFFGSSHSIRPTAELCLIRVFIIAL